MIVEQEVETFLEHHGIKGQKWGIRNAKRVGRAAKATGRGAVRAGKFVNRHKKGVAVSAGILVASGAVVVSKIKGNNAAKEAIGKAKTKQLLNMTFITDSKGRTSRYGDIAVKQFFPKEGMTFAADKIGNVTRVKDVFR